MISRRSLGLVEFKCQRASQSPFSVSFSLRLHHATLALELGCRLPPHVSSAAMVPAKTRTYRQRRSDVSEMDSVSSTYRLPRGQPWMTLRTDTLTGRRVLEAR